MKYAEIEKMFTKKVGEYIAKGYTMSFKTMNGTQGGCDVNVDFKNKNGSIIRVAILNNRDCIGKVKGRFPVYATMLSLVVGIGHPSCLGTVWNSELELIESTDYYRIDTDDWYVESLDEYLAMVEKNFDRVISRDSRHSERKLLNNQVKAKEIVLKHARKHIGCKRAKVEDISSVYLFIINGKRKYEYNCKGKHMSIGA